MATIAKPTKKFNVYNQLIGKKENAGSAHAPEYYENPDGFYCELLTSTRTNVEAVSNNNPVDITIMNELKDL